MFVCLSTFEMIIKVDSDDDDDDDNDENDYGLTITLHSIFCMHIMYFNYALHMYVYVCACVYSKDFSIENKVTKYIKIRTLLGEFYYYFSFYQNLM